MKEGNPILKRIYGVLPGASGEGRWPSGLLAQILPNLNHHAHLYLISEDLVQDWTSVMRVLEEASAFLSRSGFVRLNLRPVHPVKAGQLSRLKELYQDLSHWSAAFHREALSHQVASRWMVMPILRARSEAEARDVAELARFVRARMMIPSLCTPSSLRIAEWVKGWDPEQERILLEVPDGLLETLVLHDLLDDLQGWALSSQGGFSLEMCPGLVVNSQKEMIQRCPQQKETPYTELQAVLKEGPGEACLSCWDQVPERLRGDLQYNRREEEGERIQHQLGVFALSRGDPRMAEGHLRAVARGSSNPVLRGESLLHLGILCFQEARIEEAHRVLTEALALMPDSGSVMYHLGRCEFAWHDYIAATELFQKALEMGAAPELNKDLRLYWGISHIQLGEFEEARAVLELVIEPTAPIHFYRGMALMGLGRPEEALNSFETALASEPEGEDLSSIHFYLGHCLKEMGRWEEAFSHLESALRADPGSYEAWNLLGYCRFRTGRHREAIQAFLKALELSPRSAIDHANIGSNLRDLGDLKGAAQWYRKAIALDPTLGFAAQNLARLEERTDTGNPESRIQNSEAETQYPGEGHPRT